MTSPLQPSSLPGSLQSLSPAQARFCLSVARFVEKELGLRLTGTSLLTGFSGGADSTALLLCLHYLAPKLGYSLVAAHLDHRLRPTSEQEASLCRAFCSGLGIPFAGISRDVAALSQQRQCGVEDAGREARYQFFAETAKAYGCGWIAVGHTGNDLAEDVLMRLVRGAGWPGLSGMAGLDAQRKIIRPLLLTARSSLEDFLCSLGVHWLTDESNADQGYFRNRVRHALLPLLLGENPSFLEGVAGLWRLGRIDQEYFAAALAHAAPEKSTAPSPPGVGQENPPSLSDPGARQRLFTSRAQIAPLPKALRLRLYKKMLDHLGPGQARLSGLLALDEAFLRKAGKTKHQFSGGKLALVGSKGILWTVTTQKKE